ncbi:NmrA family protein [Leadbetterella byssophila DSM 17132]|uniref:NmrA family protein n=2 Tax=Leadbetterella TaxID=319458 RepID=E4RTH6_LEAB4|nr:NmrA family protein [Leadbetterella byssophila DSM 17132]
MKKIAIIGATGMLGEPVTKAFINEGFDVSLLVRNVNKAKQIFPSNVRLVQGDLRDIESIGQFLSEQEGLYLNLSVKQNSGKSDFQPEREGLDHVLQIAKNNTTVTRIGYLSSLIHLYQGQNGFDWWAFDLKQEAVSKIKNSGLPYSIFYPSTFMENYDKGSYRQGKNIVLAGTSKYKMYLISGNDYARQVVKTFQRDNGNNEYVIQGKEGFTADEAAKVFVENYTKEKLKIMKAPMALMSFMGLFSNKFNYGAKIVDALNNYPEKFEAEKTWLDLGEPQTKFIDYIQNV